MNDTVKGWGEALFQQQQRTLRAELTIVTPMFIGDGVRMADSVRPPSIKGALRFWWRALNWGRVLDAKRGSEKAALEQLHKDEARLFGLAAKKSVNGEEKGGQGLFRLSVEQPIKPGIQNSWPNTSDSQGGYLGYGLEKGQRNALEEGIGFVLTLSYKSSASKTDIDQMRQAVSLWGLLGGLGSRARRGFGSVALQALDGEPMTVNSSQEYASRIKDALGDGHWPEALSELPFTAWSQQARCLAFNAAPSRRQAIGSLERPYKEVRKEFKGKTKIVFGLPLGDKNKDSSKIKERRASPFIMHVHPVGEEYLPMVTYLPARFHPDYPNNPLDEVQGVKPLEMFFEQSKERLL